VLSSDYYFSPFFSSISRGLIGDVPVNFVDSFRYLAEIHTFILSAICPKINAIE
jgi:hypothetical protein